MTKDEALDLALEAFKDLEKHRCLHYPNIVKALEEALAKQEQGEPVACETCRGKLCIGEGTKDDPIRSCPSCNPKTQQRTWVGLTDEEYSVLAEKYTGADGLDCVDFGRAVARHYGIKE